MAARPSAVAARLKQVRPRTCARCRRISYDGRGTHGSPCSGKGRGRLTTIAVPLSALPIYAAALTSVMVAPLAEPEDFLRLLDHKRVTAFLIGPGAGVSEETRIRALAMLATHRPTVLDADALTAFKDDPSRLDRASIRLGVC